MAYRSYPGVDGDGAYFVRGSGHNQYGGYTEDAAEYQQVIDRLMLKWGTAKKLVPDPYIRRTRKATQYAIVSVGSCDNAVQEAIDRLSGRGIYLNYLRVKAFPFGKKVINFLHRHERVFVVEQNRDAQLKSLLCLETDYPKQRMQSILHYSGLPIDPGCIIAAIEQAVSQGEAA